MAVAEKLAEEGMDLEVIDLRTLVPLDREAVVNLVKKTHRLLLLDEDHKSYGLTYRNRGHGRRGCGPKSR